MVTFEVTLFCVHTFLVPCKPVQLRTVHCFFQAELYFTLSIFVLVYAIVDIALQAFSFVLCSLLLSLCVYICIFVFPSNSICKSTSHFQCQSIPHTPYLSLSPCLMTVDLCYEYTLPCPTASAYKEAITSALYPGKLFPYLVQFCDAMEMVMQCE